MHELPELLRRARAGDREAQDELVTRFEARVRALVHGQLQRRLRPQQHALLRQLSTGDIVQEVFVDVLRNLGRWDGDREEAFVALLATLVEHRLVDQVRRSQAARRDVRRVGDAGPATVGAVAGEAGPATMAGDHEQLRIYSEVLATFDERDRALLSLRHEQRLEFAELAERLGWQTPDAARKAFHLLQGRLLLRLRERGVDFGADA
ncbi:MAG: sigma-70 family RNA polymerase sigma factor [Planctomycetes bacterium]|nr:sigma-70 family RNA polymerase sigma factor [Planctomycetota bacterium]